jgi:LPS-assembly protein
MGTKSDWLIAGQLLTPNGVQLLSRGIFDENFSFSKAENRLTWDNDWIDVTATHLWLNTDLDEGRSEVLSEINLSTKIDLNRNWSGLFDWQYDLAAERVIRAGVGLEYGNECIDMLLSASRRFTASSTVDPSTDYDFRIGLRGFGAGRSGSDIIRTCGS